MRIQLLLATCSLLLTVNSVADFLTRNTNEFHLQYGKLHSPSFAGGNASPTTIITFQHSSAWAYGSNFLFIDYIDDQDRDGYNNNDFYGELYLSFSLEKLTGYNIDVGPLKDISLVTGLNMGKNPKVRKYLPGFRGSWQLPGFSFFNTDILAYLDDNQGLADGGAPRQSDSYQIDVSWAYPFSFGRHDFYLQGHIEYIDGRHDELGRIVHSHVLAQPQLRYDLGKAVFDSPKNVYIGIEYQYWRNKLGDNKVKDNVAQALLVWRW